MRLQSGTVSQSTQRGGDRDQRFDDLIAQVALTFDSSKISDGDVNGDVTTLDYTYDVEQANLDFLGQNDVVILTFPIKVADNEGGFDVSTVTVTITDTNDIPVIDTPAPVVTALAEAADADPATNAGQLQDLSATGSLAVTDLDVGDILTWQTSGQATATWTPFGGSISDVVTTGASRDVRFDALIIEANLDFSGTRTTDGVQTNIDYTYR